jgi:hypothetical protein
LILKLCSFTEIPSGIEVGDGKCLVLKKTIYGIVQSDRKPHVIVVKALKSCGFTGSFVDPCLWVKKFNSGIVMMAIYVDEYLATGSDGGIKEVIEA